jgi:hypothetical protein
MRLSACKYKTLPFLEFLRALYPCSLESLDMASEKQLDSPPTKEVQDVPSETSSHTPSESTLKAAHCKVDKRLLCWYALVYLIMRVHVSNISNTAIMSERPLLQVLEDYD